MRIKTSIRKLLGASLLLGAGLAAHAQVNPVFFQVDMTAITNAAGGQAASVVDIRGAFNGWSGGNGYDLVNNGAGVYTNTFDFSNDVAGATYQYKFTFTTVGGVTWEDSIGGTNRLLTIAGGAQTLPLVPFYAPSVGTPIDYVTNNVTFNVDMRAQGASFINAGGVVRVSGGFNGWGGGDLLTNDAGAPFPTNWFYSGTFPAVTQVYYPGFPTNAFFSRFKFRANGGWEEPTYNPAYGSNDRNFHTTNTSGTVILPLVLYSDASLCDVLAEDTTVTFALHLPNGTVTMNGHVFDTNAGDTVHINGESLLGAWQAWNYLLPQLYHAGNDIYTNTFLIPAGRPRNQKVKYGVSDNPPTIGVDNEAPQFSDHVQWIRSTNSSYVMSTVEFGTNYASTRVQSRFGNLNVGAPSGGTVPVTWEGCGCVTLQTRSDLASGTWTDLPETDGQSSTNVPANGQQFFRLYNRPTP